jgi:hypothetical protein
VEVERERERPRYLIYDAGNSATGLLRLFMRELCRQTLRPYLLNFVSIAIVAAAYATSYKRIFLSAIYSL